VREDREDLILGSERLVKRAALAILIQVDRTRIRDRVDRNLQFAQLTMAVIVGVVIAEVADSLNRGFGVSNYRAVLLITALLLFLEMYIVLSRYHERLKLRYANLYMFFDLFVALLFVSFVSLINYSWDHPQRVRSSLEVLTVLFLALLVRQVAAFVDLVFCSADVKELLNQFDGDERLLAINRRLVFENRDLHRKLEKIGFSQSGLFVPMGADLAGVGFGLCALLLFRINWWAWVGLVAFLIYEVVMFGFIIGASAPRIVKSAFSLGRRAGPASPNAP